MSRWHEIPSEILGVILEYLPVQDIIKMQLVNKKWNELIKNNGSAWRTLYLNSFAYLGLQETNNTRNWRERFILAWFRANEYLKEARKLPPPTKKQIDNFVEFVAGAHSWYKHLGTFSTTPFLIYLDPVAGMREFNNQWIDYVRGDGTEFHYTWKPTAEYREAFGYLGYYVNYHGETDQKVIKCYNAQNHSFLLTPFVTAPFWVELTAAVHNGSSLFNKAFLDYEKKRQEDPSTDFTQMTFSVGQWSSKSKKYVLPEHILKFFDDLYQLRANDPTLHQKSSRWESRENDESAIDRWEGIRQKGLLRDATVRLIKLIFPSHELK